ncbi:acyl-coenzyme A thioesterase 1-like [Anomaloglossus baeobatrachus]|uniref:acyl-coenzyme A thioesterase 1-like n=1 Tax=Anomaloglossus baeobatrachus TaxID=238106 RepID=UPI003F4FF615
MLLSVFAPAVSRLHRTLLPGSARAMSAVSLLVSPERCLYDRPLQLRVLGLSPGQDVTLRTALSDDGGELFTSAAHYRADGGGEVDVSRSPGLAGGSYTGVDPGGPLWSVQPRTPYRRLVKKDVRSPLRLRFSLHPGHGGDTGEELLAEAAQERSFLGEGVRREPLREGRVRGSLFLPPGPGPFPGVIEVPGAGGGLLEYKASLLASRGFATLALAYYNYEDLPKDMKALQLEYFEEAVNYMLQHPQVKGPGIGLLGHSKGGDLVFSMSAFLKGITATVVVNGSVANIGAVLSYKDNTLLPIGIDTKKVKYPKPGIADIHDLLYNPLEESHRKSLIPVGKADCKFLLIVGEDDRNWNSTFHAQAACQLLVDEGKEKPEIVYYPKTGHYIEPPYIPLCEASMHRLVGLPVIWGGKPKEHAMAQVDSWQRIQAFFHEHLNKTEVKSKVYERVVE